MNAGVTPSQMFLTMPVPAGFRISTRPLSVPNTILLTASGCAGDEEEMERERGENGQG